MAEPEEAAGIKPGTWSVRLIVLEGPAPAAEAASAVQQAAAEANTALWQISQGKAGARDQFDTAQHDFHVRLTIFIETSRSGMAELD